MDTKNIIFDSTNDEEISFSKFLKIYPKEKDNIESAEIIPPTIGKKDFGKIRIKYKIPHYFRISQEWTNKPTEKKG